MSRPILSVAFVLCGILAGSACASQSEGQRCSTLSGNDDCETGLVCTLASQLAQGANESNATWGLCCPPSDDRSRQPVEACFPATSTPGTAGSTGSGGADSGTSTGGSAGSSTGGSAGSSTGGSAGGSTGGSAGRDSGAKTGGSTGTGGAAPSDAASEGGG